MADFEIRGRIDPAGPGGFLAKVWLCPAGSPSDCEAGIRHACTPCSMAEARAACDSFVQRISYQLSSAGHRLVRVVIDEEAMRPSGG
jgi:hypothetical protein